MGEYVCVEFVCECVGFVVCGCVHVWGLKYVCICGFYNVWVCLCMAFVMCGCVFVYVWVL